MTDHKPPALTLLATGIPGLDEVLAGGLPEFSFNLIAGAPGAGKTTLIHQFLFANASEQRRALYFTVLGEPSLKMLRYQQQMEFFDPDKVGGAIRFVDLSPEALERDLKKVLERIVQLVQEVSPAFVVVDSFRTLLRSDSEGAKVTERQEFLQRLALHLTSWHATTFLLGEYVESEMQNNPVFTIADGILWLSQVKERNSIIRKLQVVKMRGSAAVSGLHTFRLGADGVRVYPRFHAGFAPGVPPSHGRLTFGIPRLDAMMGGGIPAGDAVLVAGPSGCGKTLLSSHFVVEGRRHREACVVALFEEQPEAWLERAKLLGVPVDEALESGGLKLIFMRPLDLSTDQILSAIRESVSSLNATRLVIDSLNGLELSLTPEFREDFRESLYRMVGGLTEGGVTVLMTVEVMEHFDRIAFSPHAISFLSQNIIHLRYVELEGELARILAIVKMRRSAHSKQLARYEVTGEGFTLSGRVVGYEGLLTGVPRAKGQTAAASVKGLTADESAVLDVLMTRDEASARELAQLSGLPEAAVAQGLQALLHFNYVIRVSAEPEAVYRAVVQRLSPP